MHNCSTSYCPLQADPASAATDPLTYFNKIPVKVGPACIATRIALRKGALQRRQHLQQRLACAAYSVAGCAPVSGRALCTLGATAQPAERAQQAGMHNAKIPATATPAPVSFPTAYPLTQTLWWFSAQNIGLLQLRYPKGGAVGDPDQQPVKLPELGQASV